MMLSWKHAIAVVALYTGHALSQNYKLAPSSYTDAVSGIKLETWSTLGVNGIGAFSFGFALPANAAAQDATEYIGRLECQTINSSLTGWCGIAHGGHMTSDLLLMAWPYQNHVYTSFRWASDYFKPIQFGGENGTNGTTAAFPAPRLSIISTKTNQSSYEIIYRCQNCLSWQQGTYNETIHTAGEDNSVLVLGYAQAAKGPTNPYCTGTRLDFGFHDNGYAQWGAPVQNATSSYYGNWTKLATQTPNAGANNTADTCKRYAGEQ